MASNQVDTSDEVDFSVFGVELPRLNPYAQDMYGCLLNNGMYVFQPNCKMDLRVVKAALGCYYQTVRLVYIQSPQVAYVDICIGKELTSPGFWQYFFTGIHRATFPENPVLDCNVVFSPLSESVRFWSSLFHGCCHCWPEGIARNELAVLPQKFGMELFG